MTIVVQAEGHWTPRRRRGGVRRRRRPQAGRRGAARGV